MPRTGRSGARATVTSPASLKASSNRLSSNVKQTQTDNRSLYSLQNSATSKKRKIEETSPSTPSQRDVIDLTASSPVSSSKKRKQEPSEEKRLKRYRPHPPQSCVDRIYRAQTQRMIVIKRARTDDAGYPVEDIDIVGSTGNIYTVTIDRLPSCTCPDNAKGNQCKHIYYALTTVLKAPYDLQYQLAFLTSELRDIFATAPPIPNDATDEHNADQSKRKSTDAECPICYMDLEPSKHELVWCKTACGNNMHKSCFDQWTASQRGQVVKCVYCRTPWHTDVGDADAIKTKGEVTGDGYVNVADQFGIDRGRNYSSYHQPWVRQHFGMGW